MAQQTAQSVMGIPGMVHSFVAKTEAEGIAGIRNLTPLARSYNLTPRDRSYNVTPEGRSYNLTPKDRA